MLSYRAQYPNKRSAGSTVCGSTSSVGSICAGSIPPSSAVKVLPTYSIPPERLKPCTVADWPGRIHTVGKSLLAGFGVDSCDPGLTRTSNCMILTRLRDDVALRVRMISGGRLALMVADCPAATRLLPSRTLWRNQSATNTVPANQIKPETLGESSGGGAATDSGSLDIGDATIGALDIFRS